MRIERIPLDQIRTAAYNPRQDLRPGHPQYEAIKNSIERWTLLEPLVWNERTGNLVGGHQRLKVIQAQEAEEVDVSVVNLDPQEEKALNVALNRAQGEWDQAALDAIILELAESGQAQAATFSPQEVDDLLLRLQVDRGEADYNDLMGPAVERPDQPPREERVTITLRAGKDVLTRERIKEIRGTWAHLGVEVDVKEGGATE